MWSVLSTAWRIVVRRAISDRLNLIKQLVASEGVTAIVATHDSALIDLADRIVDLRDGEIAADTG
jgi:ABC-type lipoprotein export system ATPase subunit